MDTFACIVFFVAWFAGSFVNGVSGLGAAMLALPFITLVVGLEVAVPASCLVGGVISLFLVWAYRKSIMYHEGLVMAAGSLPGAALGAMVLSMVPAQWLCLGLGTLLLFFVGWQLHAHRLSGTEQAPRRLWLGFLAGGCGGFGNAAVGIGGPPLAIYATLQNWDKDAARGTFGFYYLIMSGITIFFQAIEGLYTPATLEAAMWGVPGALAGLFASLPCAHAIRQDSFTKILLAVIAASGVLMLIQGF